METKKCYSCSVCGSEDIKSFPVIYEMGTSYSSSKTKGIGITSSLSVGVGGASTSGVSMTKMAHKCAPPSQMGYGASIFWCFFISFVAMYITDTPPLFLVVFAISGYILIYNGVYKYNEEEWPKKMKRWRNTYMCLKCGSVLHLKT